MNKKTSGMEYKRYEKGISILAFQSTEVRMMKTFGGCWPAVRIKAENRGNQINGIFVQLIYLNFEI